MKYLYQLIFVLFLFPVVVLSQNNPRIGIMTHSPEKLFHIDASGDNESSAQPGRYENDVVVDENGNVGIGTIAPTAKLHIKKTDNSASALLFDNSRNSYTQGHVVTSDVDGNIVIKVPETGLLYTWRLGVNPILLEADFKKITGPTTTDITYLPGIVADPSNYSLFVPKGKYMLLFIGDMNTTEYVTYRLQGTYVNLGTTEEIVSIPYSSYLNSVSVYFDFKDDINLEMYIKGLNPARGFMQRANGIGATLSGYYIITFMRLL